MLPDNNQEARLWSERTTVPGGVESGTDRPPPDKTTALGWFRGTVRKGLSCWDLISMSAEGCGPRSQTIFCPRRDRQEGSHL